jgi:beta-glucosidase
MDRLNDMNRRILRSMFAAGVIDDPPVRSVVDPFRGRDDSRHIAEESIVLLKNAGNQLPLKAASLHSIAIIGGHADVGVLSGAVLRRSTRQVETRSNRDKVRQYGASRSIFRPPP